MTNEPYDPNVVPRPLQWVLSILTICMIACVVGVVLSLLGVIG